MSGYWVWMANRLTQVQRVPVCEIRLNPKQWCQHVQLCIVQCSDAEHCKRSVKSGGRFESGFPHAVTTVNTVNAENRKPPGNLYGFCICCMLVAAEAGVGFAPWPQWKSSPGSGFGHHSLCVLALIFVFFMLHNLITLITPFVEPCCCFKSHKFMTGAFGVLK